MLSLSVPLLSSFSFLVFPFLLWILNHLFVLYFPLIGLKYYTSFPSVFMFFFHITILISTNFTFSLISLFMFCPSHLHLQLSFSLPAPSKNFISFSHDRLVFIDWLPSLALHHGWDYSSWSCPPCVSLSKVVNTTQTQFDPVYHCPTVNVTWHRRFCTWQVATDMGWVDSRSSH